MSEREFAGVPIIGTLCASEQNSLEQYPAERLAAPLRAALAHPRFVAIHWHQYTPYFNDGEPCFFSVDDIYFRILDEGEESVDVDAERERLESEGTWRYMDDGESAWLHSGELTMGKVRWNREVSAYEVLSPPPTGVDAITEVAELMSSGHFENALMGLFGDHADVLITRDKIVIEEYDHE